MWTSPPIAQSGGLYTYVLTGEELAALLEALNETEFRRDLFAGPGTNIPGLPWSLCFEYENDTGTIISFTTEGYLYYDSIATKHPLSSWRTKWVYGAQNDPLLSFLNGL